MDRPLTVEDIAIMRRSLGMSPALPTDQLGWVLDEAERLLRDRARLAELERRLRGPWREVRAALNELHGLVEGTG